MLPAYPNPLPNIADALDAWIRADLEQIRYEYFVCLLICTGAVFVGLVCEVGEIWHDVVSFFRRDRIAQEYAAAPALIRKERQPSHRVKMWAAIGWLLIVIGVGGEGVFDGLVSWADSTLQTFNTILLTATQKEAGSAAESAKIAHNEALAATLEANAAKDVAGKAKTEARGAEATAQGAAGMANATKRELTSEHEKRMQLEKTLAPRVIEIIGTPVGSTVDVLKPFASMSVIIESIPDWEARRAAANVRGVMEAAGLSIESDEVLERNMPDGVTIELYDPASLPAETQQERFAMYDEWDRVNHVTEEIVAFFKANDWEASEYRFEPMFAPKERDLAKNEIRVRVGFKPAPYFKPDFILKSDNPDQAKRVAEIRKQIEYIKRELLKAPGLSHPPK
jgi:hypothetical protein